MNEAESTNGGTDLESSAGSENEPFSNIASFRLPNLYIPFTIFGARVNRRLPRLGKIKHFLGKCPFPRANFPQIGNPWSTAMNNEVNEVLPPLGQFVLSAMSDSGNVAAALGDLQSNSMLAIKYASTI